MARWPMDHSMVMQDLILTRAIPVGPQCAMAWERPFLNLMMPWNQRHGWPKAMNKLILKPLRLP